MKIILQSEAKTISDRDIAKNQQYLIDLLVRISSFNGIFARYLLARKS